MVDFPAEINLDETQQGSVFEIDGEAADNRSGFSVDIVNGFGQRGEGNIPGQDPAFIGSVLIGSYGNDPGGGRSLGGALHVTYAFFGTGLTMPEDTFQLGGESAFDFAGFSVSTVGDFNGDGLTDVIIGAYGVDRSYAVRNVGAAYVVFGKAFFDEEEELSPLDNTSGFRIGGENGNDGLGFSVAGAGDFNGDGLADIVVGTKANGPNGSYSGGAYLILGTSTTGFNGEFDLSTLTGPNGFQINGEAMRDYAGQSVNAAGDINGDGFDDLIISAAGVDPNGYGSGATYVVFGNSEGGATGVLELSSLNGTNGFQINGPLRNGAFPNRTASVAGAGDINGDGFDDLIIGSVRENAAFVVFCKGSAFTAELELSSLNGGDGVRLDGPTNSATGASVSAAGDVNADGFDDVIIGATGGGTPDDEGAPGAAYVVFGKSAAFAATFDLTTLNGNNGFAINGEAGGDGLGVSVGGGDDANGDGIDDVIVGAPDADPNGNNSGASYLVFGRTPSAGVTRTGSVIGQTIRGSAFNDVLIGLDGDDTLLGLAGADVLKGDAGADVLDGGAGADSADYRDRGVAVVVTLNGAINAVVTIGGVAEDIVRNVEQVYGGSAGDILTGGVTGNFLNGFNGNDVLKGGGGNDALLGSIGLDTADYRDKTQAVSVTLNANSAVILSVGGVAEDTISNIEVIYGGSAADSLTGDVIGNLFRGGGGADVIDGGGGVDAIAFRDKSAAVVLQLAGAANATATVGGVAEDIVRNVENVYGGLGNDGLVGDGFANQLFGGGGADTLRGLGGADRLTGGPGVDVYQYNAVAESTPAARDTILDFSRADLDRIVLNLIDANAGVAGNQAFVIGAFQAGIAGRLRITANGANSYLVEGDVNGDAAADFALVVNSVTALASVDFAL